MLAYDTVRHLPGCKAALLPALLTHSITATERRLSARLSETDSIGLRRNK